MAQALEIYLGNRKDENFDEIALTGFALYMDEQIKALHDIRG